MTDIRDDKWAKQDKHYFPDLNTNSTQYILQTDHHSILFQLKLYLKNQQLYHFKLTEKGIRHQQNYKFEELMPFQLHKREIKSFCQDLFFSILLKLLHHNPQFPKISIVSNSISSRIALWENRTYWQHIFENNHTHCVVCLLWGCFALSLFPWDHKMFLKALLLSSAL